VAWIARFVPTGEDPLVFLVQAAAACGWDVNPEDIGWAEGKDLDGEDMIPVNCYVNTGDFKEYRWPKVMASTPRVGEYVVGYKPDGNCVKLQILCVTHDYSTDTEEAWLLVELDGSDW
jgi:hypothetical protein